MENRTNGIGNAPVTPQQQPVQPEEIRRPRRSGRLNRAVTKLKNAFRRTPRPPRASAERLPKTSLRDRTITKQDISAPVQKSPPRQALDKLFIYAQGDAEKLKEPEAQKEFQRVRNQYLHTALKVTEDARALFWNSNDLGSVQEADVFIESLHEAMHSESPVTPESIKDLMKYPKEFTNYSSKELGLDKETVTKDFDYHLNSDETATLQNQFFKVPYSGTGAHSTHDHKELFKLQTLQYQAAKEVIANEIKAASRPPEPNLIKTLQKANQRLDHEYGRLEGTVRLNGNDFVSGKEMKVAKEEYPELLKGVLVEAGVDAAEVNAKFQEAYVHTLNSREWKTVEKTFRHEEREFTSTQKPASQLQAPVGPDGIKRKVLKYQDVNGVTSLDTKNTKHATGLFHTSLKIGKKQAFSGIRHGIADPYGLKGSINRQLRVNGGRAKAEEIFLAALSTKPELFQQALKAAEDGSAAPKLVTTSTSLVTTGLGSSKEREMQEMQNAAFRHFADAEQPITLMVPGPDGQERKVKFELKQSRFNIPVNAGGVGFFSFFTGGRRNERRMNNTGINELIGREHRDGSVGGIAGERLQQLSAKENNLQQQVILEKAKTNKDDALIKQLQTEINDVLRERRTIADLSHQIRDIFRHGRHHHHHHDAYKLAARVTLLTHMADGVALMNCKSGKDRTGMLDAEIKFLAARINQDTGEVPEPGRLTEEEQEMFREFLKETGNFEVQEDLVGVRGYKTEHVDSIDERINDDSAREEVRGLSKTVGS